MMDTYLVFHSNVQTNKPIHFEVYQTKGARHDLFLWCQNIPFCVGSFSFISFSLGTTDRHMAGPSDWLYHICELWCCVSVVILHGVLMKRNETLKK
mmetsp:Transcript_27953/g.43002  ORF Transcript_27953/g.43002 Transcript_27953/m.43002 type:complete len:96 (+) Transcript_27953:126-413(+)